MTATALIAFGSNLENPAEQVRRAIAAGQVSGQLYTGEWADVGTPQRLAALNA